MYVKYKAPVTYPDTVSLPFPQHADQHSSQLLIANKPHEISQTRASFKLAATFYSLSQNRIVAEADCTIVMYDYDRLGKGTMSDEFKAALLARVPEQNRDGEASSQDGKSA